MTIYIRYQDLAAAGASADVIGIGDSWLWHPMGNLTPELDNCFAGQSILLIGDAGKEAAELASPTEPYFELFQRALSECSGTLKRVFISAGGNDFAGQQDFASILKQDCSDCAAPAECFDLPAMRQRFDRIARDVGKLVAEVNARAPQAAIRLHNYDYAIPDGRRKLGDGHWLKTPMDDCRVPQPGTLQRGGFRREVVATLIDTFGHWMADLASRHANTRFVRTSGTVADSQWLDELHPTPGGFKKIARVFAA